MRDIRANINLRATPAARRARLAVAVVAVLIGGVLGCGKERDKRFVPVSGTITLDGQPLDGAAISFLSQEDQFSGHSGPDGRYELKPGARPGEYRVDVSKYGGDGGVPLGLDPGAGGEPGEQPPQSTPIKQLVPAHYSDPNQTELTFTVPAEGTRSADFDLTGR